MALINCPVCGKAVSDKAKNCPGCGAVLISKEEIKVKKSCPECGCEVSEGASVCHNCGYPLLEESKKADSKPVYKKKSFWIITVFAIIVIALGTILGVAVSKIIRHTNYHQNMKDTINSMIDGSVLAETTGNTILNVWNDAIYENEGPDTKKYTQGAKDFDEALDRLFADEEFQKQLDDIKSNKLIVTDYMRKLKNPPDEYKDLYQKINELYDLYIDFTGLALSPSGSYNSFSSEILEKDDELTKLFNKIFIEFDY